MKKKASIIKFLYICISICNFFTDYYHPEFRWMTNFQILFDTVQCYSYKMIFTATSKDISLSSCVRVLYTKIAEVDRTQ